MWNCPKCGEKLDEQFDSCWKCAGQSDSNVRYNESEHSKGLPPFFRITLILFVFTIQLMMLAPSLAVNTSKVSYRRQERFDAMKAYFNERTPEKKAAFDEEMKKVNSYIAHEQLMNIGIPFAALLFFEGVVFYYLFWHKRRS